VLAMKKRLFAAYPQATWYEYEALTSDSELEGSRLAFGKSLRTRIHLDKASVVVSLDADLLGTHPAHVRYAADWAEKRRGNRERDKRHRAALKADGWRVIEIWECQTRDAGLLQARIGEVIAQLR